MNVKALIDLFAEFVEQGGVTGHSKGYVRLNGKDFEFDISLLGFKLSEIPSAEEFETQD